MQYAYWSRAISKTQNSSLARSGQKRSLNMYEALPAFYLKRCFTQDIWNFEGETTGRTQIFCPICYNGSQEYSSQISRNFPKKLIINAKNKF